MTHKHLMSNALLATAAAVVAWGTGSTVATATEPCDDFGECKALIEINASDGDIGFHFLKDGDDLFMTEVQDPNGETIFMDSADGALLDQMYTETFVESAEPLCWDDPDADPEDEIVTLEEFLERWTPGDYVFLGNEGALMGTSPLTHNLPAAPADLDFDDSVISWDSGDDLGECGSKGRLTSLVARGVLPEHPKDVEVAAWEVVLEPDVEDGDPQGALVFSIRVPVDQLSVTVPAEYLAALEDDTPAKIEVGAIGVDDNATFSEEGGFCINDVEGCEED